MLGGHHAGRTDFWGGCYLNPVAIAIEGAREKFGIKRLAIIDTDSHHADGTRAIFKDDDAILHICFCFSDTDEVWGGGTKVNIHTPFGISDEEYLAKVEKEIPRVFDFEPGLIFWMCGLDTHRDSYGLRSLTHLCYPELAKIVKQAADRICEGKLVVRTACNAPAPVTQYVMPRIVDCLGELGRY